MHFRPKYAPEFVVLQGAGSQMVIANDVVSGMKSCEIRSRFNGIALQNQPFHTQKVHIKYEKRKNVAITLSIKDLKGLLEVA